MDYLHKRSQTVCVCPHHQCFPFIAFHRLKWSNQIPLRLTEIHFARGQRLRNHPNDARLNQSKPECGLGRAWFIFIDLLKFCPESFDEMFMANFRTQNLIKKDKNVLIKFLADNTFEWHLKRAKQFPQPVCIQASRCFTSDHNSIAWF